MFLSSCSCVVMGVIYSKVFPPAVAYTPLSCWWILFGGMPYVLAAEFNDLNVTPVSMHLMGLAFLLWVLALGCFDVSLGLASREFFFAYL